MISALALYDLTIEIYCPIKIKHTEKVDLKPVPLPLFWLVLRF